MRQLLIGFMLIALAACSLVKVAPMTTYSFHDYKPKSQPGFPKSKLTMYVAEPVASPGYRSNAMIYTQTPYELKAYAKNAWVAPPTQMLLPLVIGSLQQTGYFFAVVSPPYSGRMNLRLEIRLLALQQEFVEKNSRERLAIQATVINVAQDKIIGSKRFEVVVPALENSPYGGVLAANRAVDRVTSQMAAYVVKLAIRHRDS